MYNDTITLFNRCKNSLGDTWYPVVLSGVDVNMDRASIIKTMGENATDTVTLHVKYTRDAQGNILVGDKRYILPKEYSKLPVEEIAQYLTFKSGNDFDFFYVGEWDGNGPISDDEYKKGFYSYMNAQFDNVFVISTASGAYDLIPHFEILGK